MPGTSPKRLPDRGAGRAIVAATLGLLAHAAVSRAEPEGGDVLTYAAEVRAMVEVCREETPTVTAHLGQAYSAWLEHNPVVREARICCVSWRQASSGPASSDQAARPKTRWTKARCAGTSLAGTRRTCPLASIAIASTPARVRRAVQKP